ncbi:MAG TPA: DUF1800 family protein, partial [Burkholderiales bacterium]|nr:DUF1800 family protein [Burkholderiales bacterium]
PATAEHLAFKLVRHFITDEPTAAMVNPLKQKFLQTGGNLRAVAMALIDLRRPLPCRSSNCARLTNTRSPNIALGDALQEQRALGALRSAAGAQSNGVGIALARRLF